MFFALLWVLALCGTQAVHTPDFYTAAVVEHVRHDDPQDRQASIKKNLDVYQEAAKGASSLGADIIVYPEMGIIPSYLMTRTLMVKYYEAIPDPLKTPPWTPCQNPDSNFPVLTRLSRIAKDYGIYVVANVGGKEPCSPQNDTRCPPDVKTLFYNTNVVFDSNGTLIARHRKRFPFFEIEITRPTTPEYTVFNTSFGSFAVVICFDAAFQEAVEVVKMFGVENMIISTWWFDELPFISSLQYFQGWGLGNRVNVLASSIHQPHTGTIGSLIASGLRGSLAYTFEPTLSKSEVLLARVPRTRSYSDTVKVSKARSLDGYAYTNTDMSQYTLTKLESLSGSIESCNNGLCCHLNYTSNTRPDNFYFGAFSGIANINHHYFFCQEVCTLVLCTSGTQCTSFPTHSGVSFQSVSMRGNIRTPYQYPSAMASEMNPVPHKNWEFSPGHLEISGVSDPLLSVTIHGRCYDKDPPFPETESRNHMNDALYDKMNLNKIISLMAIVLYCTSL